MRGLRLIVALAALAMFAAACGGGSDATETSTAPAATEAPADPTAVPEEPATEVPVEPTEVPAEPTAVPVEAEPEVPEVVAYEPAAQDDPAMVDAGAAVFAASCSGCHGADGTGSDRGRPLTGIAAQQPDRLVHFTSVSDGKGSMPAFSSRLTGEEIDAALSYVRLTFLPVEADEPDGEGAAPVASEEESAMMAAGANLFAENCASCHGAAGEGTSRGRPLIDISIEQPDTAVHELVVLDGKGRMPAFGEKLTPEEITAVVAYVHGTF